MEVTSPLNLFHKNYKQDTVSFNIIYLMKQRYNLMNDAKKMEDSEPELKFALIFMLHYYILYIKDNTLYLLSLAGTNILKLWVNIKPPIFCYKPLHFFTN